jgi:hypothetical protein
MYQNHTLPELVSNLELQNSQKSDYIINPKILKMEEGVIHAPKTKGLIYTPNAVFHENLQAKLAIPGQYYRRMQAEVPELLDHSVNAWMQTLPNSGMMLRSFERSSGNIARAFLSDRYNALDNYDVLFAALEAIQKSGARVEVKECDVTDRKMYINVVAPEIEIQAPSILKDYLRNGKINAGDGIVSGFCIVNSEVGFGTFEVKARALILKCNNGMMSNDDKFRKVHLGAKLSEGSINWSEATRKRNMELIISQVQDAVAEFLSKDYLNGMIKKLEKASQQPLEHPLDAVQNVCKEVGKVINMDDRRRNSILNHFIQGGDTKASGIFHALTMEAHAMEPDEKHDMEELAFGLLPKLKQFDKQILIAKN